MRVDTARLVEQEFSWVQTPQRYRPRPAVGWRESPSRDHPPKERFLCRRCYQWMPATPFVNHAWGCVGIYMVERRQQ